MYKLSFLFKTKKKGEEQMSFTWKTLSPWTPQAHKTRPMQIVKTKESYLWDENGKRYIDWTSGLMVVNLGHAHEEINEAIKYGIIKMNIDTDLQFAFTEGIRDYIIQNVNYLNTQIGNPEGDSIPNKKFYDPRKWVRLGEISFKNRLIKAFKDLNNINTL